MNNFYSTTLIHNDVYRMPIHVTESFSSFHLIHLRNIFDSNFDIIITQYLVNQTLVAINDQILLDI
jgi:Na+-transporting NADH:ubiquinone oxidoreductase subunit NqrD